MTTRKGNVFFRSIHAGCIEETDAGYQFTYDSAYLASGTAEPLCITLPLKPEPFTSKTLLPFFDGLIPEGWLLAVAAKNWKINERDRMGLLLTVCKDCIGAVSVEGCNE
jgi:serine/threonine-protein kinase HipA